MAYRAVIFDLDGVICHTDQYHYQAWKQLADSLGLAFDETVNNQLRGVSRMESLEIVLGQKSVEGHERLRGDYTDEEKEAFATKKNELYRKLLENMTEKDLSYEVKETLQQLRDKGLLLSIGSSSKNAKFILGRIGLGDFFDAVSDGTNITRSKPDPEVFLKAADMVGVPYDECMVVEDAVSGIAAACAAGMHSAAIGDAVKSGEATYRLTTFSDLLQIV